MLFLKCSVEQTVSKIFGLWKDGYIVDGYAQLISLDLPESNNLSSLLILFHIWSGGMASIVVYFNLF